MIRSLRENISTDLAPGPRKLLQGLPMAGRAEIRTHINELPRSKLRGISGMRIMVIPPHPRIKYGASSALSREGRGNMVTPQQAARDLLIEENTIHTREAS
jgi:hypothetical protein